MAPRIVPGGRHSRGTCVRVRAAAAPALPVRSHRPRLAAPPHLLVRPTKGGRPCPRRALASTSRPSLYISRTGGTCSSAAPRLRRLLVGDKHFLRWTRDGTWDRALAELHHPGPPCPRPQPEPSAGVIDSCSIKASPVRGPRGFDGAKKIDGIKRHIVVDTLGLLVAVLATAASVQDRAAVPRLLGRARWRCPGARPSLGRPGLHRQRRAGREQGPAVHDPDRGRDQAQGRLYHPASSLGRRADFRLDAPLPTPHPPVPADPTGP
jgi:hypothetical protein